MISPASDKFVALSVYARENLEQGSVVQFTQTPAGKLAAFAVDSGSESVITNFGTFLAYYITPDSEDVTFVGAPQTTTFTLNTDTGVGGGTQVITSGVECVALAGSGVALVRMDGYSLYGNPTDLSSYTPGTVLKLNATGTAANICLEADYNVNIVTAMVVQNDGNSIVVLLR